MMGTKFTKKANQEPIRHSIWTFDKPKKIWTNNQKYVDSKSKSETSISSDLIIATYNVWFDSHRKEDRCKGLAKLLYDSKADIIALQEVTTEFLKIFLAFDSIRNEFAISDATGETFNGFGVAIFVRISDPARLKLNKFSFHELESTQGKN